MITSHKRFEMKALLMVGLVYSSTVLFSACATNHRLDVKPGIDGLHRVTVRTVDVTDGNREAVQQAENYCNEINKSAFFYNDEGKMKGANKTGTNTTPSNKKEVNSDGQEQAVEDDKKYVIDMIFKCL